jgi:hypothetical protein
MMQAFDRIDTKSKGYISINDVNNKSMLLILFILDAKRNRFLWIELQKQKEIIGSKFVDEKI